MGNEGGDPVDREIDKYLRQIEKGARGVVDATTALRAALAPSEEGAKPWGRMMLSVLAELQRRGGRVHKSVFADIGELYGYDRHGMGGFYQGLVRHEGGYTVLTEVGEERLAILRDLHEELPPAA
jgi:hypothetical protein